MALDEVFLMASSFGGSKSRRASIGQSRIGVQYIVGVLFHAGMA
jgi:hypothetical protein